MKKIETTKSHKIVVFVNNYFPDKFFIDVVYSAGKEVEFETATYNTIQECVNYSKLFYETFEEYLDDNFYKEFNKI
jgi:hypothetical protein